ncbi:AAA family ATPase [Amycolatopsis thailandensis]|uniref:AAA family ATPase n=1 Tax=Amycolatopsis thailandensis TaxID=589330 RepID=UPI003638D10B
MDFVVIFGPPAVGKMTVGEELCKLTGFKLFHNHMAVEPVLGIFPFGSPPFGRLVNEFRRRIIEEAADAELPGLVFTYVWGLELPEDAELIGSYVDIVGSRGGRTRFVELYSDLDERLKRNSTELRLDRKPSKRDLEFSHANLLALDRDYVMNTDEIRRVHAQDLIERHGHLRIDNTRLSPAETAALIQRRMPQ